MPSTCVSVEARYGDGRALLIRKGTQTCKKNKVQVQIGPTVFQAMMPMTMSEMTTNATTRAVL